eukprot:586217-Pleurochrysis_carterae.AAC.1
MTHDPCTRRKRIGALVFVDVSKRLKRRRATLPPPPPPRAPALAHGRTRRRSPSPVGHVSHKCAFAFIILSIPPRASVRQLFE